MNRTDKQVAAGQVRSLRTLRAKLLTMADEWEGLDEYIRTCLTELADHAEMVSIELLGNPSPAELGDLP
jgi:hypothetical protein